MTAAGATSRLRCLVSCRLLQRRPSRLSLRHFQGPARRGSPSEAQGQRGDAKKFKAVGFAAYLNKPVDESVLYNALRQVAGITTNEQPLITVYTSSELPKFNARVLVVEDNITNQIVAKCMLEEFGIQVDVAANGEEALTALETLSYDLVFMDCQMPVMDGYEATRSIREPTFNFHASREHDRAIPIIAMTANTMQGDREKCLAAGMDDFIAKPVEPEKLQQALQRWLPEPEAEEAPQIVDINLNKASKTEVLQQQASTRLVIWDQADALKRVMGKQKILKTLVNSFINDLPMYIEQLALNLQQQDSPAAAKSAHAIKGVAANLSAIALADAASRLERACLDHSGETIPAEIRAIETELSDFYAETQTVLQQWQAH